MKAENKTVKIIIAAHKKYKMPKDSMYLPIFVGAEGKVNKDGTSVDIGFTKDNTGDNISSRNSSFCELTGLYWAWKNLEADYLGLAHYRRHFSISKGFGKTFDDILKSEEIAPYLGNIRVFVPAKRRYFIETLYSHYAHSHYAGQLDVTREIIKEKYPKYIDAYDKVLKRTYGYMFNMMIMDRELMDSYCTWLFDILFELEKRIDMPDLSPFQGRFYGRVSEIIFNVWLVYQLEHGVIKSNQIKELGLVYTEKINWKKKITSFFKAKFFHKKYEGSF